MPLPMPRLRCGRAIVWGVLAMCGCGDPPLVNSIRRGDKEASEKLLAQGADVNARDSKGQTALHLAIEAADQMLYENLLKRGADPNLCDEQGTSVVHLAAMQNDVFWLRQALQWGGNPNQPNTGNRHSPDSTPIFYALSARKPQNVRELIAAGADLNHRNHFGTRPLRSAMESGMMAEMIEMIEAGADPKLTDNNGKTILDCCGWFDDGVEQLLLTEDDKQAYRQLKAFLIEKGHLPPE